VKVTPDVLKFLIVVEQTQTGYSAYAPDVPGCIVTGSGAGSLA
jgi:predicted RNase H-like HicB family nuclease